MTTPATRSGTIGDHRGMWFSWDACARLCQLVTVTGTVRLRDHELPAEGDVILVDGSFYEVFLQNRKREEFFAERLGDAA